MVNETTTPQKNNSLSLLIKISIIIGIVVILGTVGVLAVYLTAPTDTKPSNTQPGVATVDRSLVPLAEKFTVTQKTVGGKPATFSFTVNNIPDQYYVEYKLEDNSSRTLATGKILKPETVTGGLLLKDNTTVITVNLRVVSSEGYSSWVVAGTSNNVEVEDTGDTKRPVADAFYTTPWAYKTDTTPQALATALETAFPGVEAGLEPDLTLDPGTCYWGNSSDVQAGEIVRPSPDMGDQNGTLQLVAGVSQQSDTMYTINYYWCQIAQ